MPSAAIGAVIAACIAAAVSLLGLIISKEQKTSEFRQAWIDALRAELTIYLTSVNSISDAIRHSTKSGSEKLELLSPLYSALNSASFNISLRVNRSEDNTKILFGAMKEFEVLFSSGDIVSPAQLRPVEKKFLTAAQDLLKCEWRRVKSGEMTFQFAKYACALVLICSLGYGIYFLAGGNGVKSLSDTVDSDRKSAMVNVVVSPSVESPAAATAAPN